MRILFADRPRGVLYRQWRVGDVVIDDDGDASMVSAVEDDGTPQGVPTWVPIRTDDPYVAWLDSYGPWPPN